MPPLAAPCHLVVLVAAPEWHTPLDSCNHCCRRLNLLASRLTPSPLPAPRRPTQPPAVPHLRASSRRGHLTGRRRSALAGGHRIAVVATSLACRCASALPRARPRRRGGGSASVRRSPRRHPPACAALPSPSHPCAAPAPIGRAAGSVVTRRRPGAPPGARPYRREPPPRPCARARGRSWAGERKDEWEAAELVASTAEEAARI